MTTSAVIATHVRTVSRISDVSRSAICYLHIFPRVFFFCTFCNGDRESLTSLTLLICADPYAHHCAPPVSRITARVLHRTYGRTDFGITPTARDFDSAAPLPRMFTPDDLDWRVQSVLQDCPYRSPHRSSSLTARISARLSPFYADLNRAGLTISRRAGGRRATSRRRPSLPPLADLTATLSLQRYDETPSYETRSPLQTHDSGRLLYDTLRADAAITSAPTRAHRHADAARDHLGEHPEGSPWRIVRDDTVHEIVCQRRTGRNEALRQQRARKTVSFTRLTKGFVMYQIDATATQRLTTSNADEMSATSQRAPIRVVVTHLGAPSNTPFHIAGLALETCA